jgi:hypothetical protein
VLRCMQAWRAAAAEGAAVVVGVTGALRALWMHQVLAAWWGYVQEQVGQSGICTSVGSLRMGPLLMVGLLQEPAVHVGFALNHGCHDDAGIDRFDNLMLGCPHLWFCLPCFLTGPPAPAG